MINFEFLDLKKIELKIFNVDSNPIVQLGVKLCVIADLFCCVFAFPVTHKRDSAHLG